MITRTFAQIMGVLYLLGGIMGFVPAFVTPGSTGYPSMTIETGYGYLFGLFPVNLLHNLVHLGIGAWGLGASRDAFSSKFFARGLAIFYGTLAVMGLVPILDTVFGLIPLFGHDIWLHAMSATLASYFGWGWTDTKMQRERGHKSAMKPLEQG